MKNEIWRYSIATYIVFWVMLVLIGGTASFILDVSNTTMRFVTAICSWAPTITLIIMYKKLEPNSSLKEFYKKAFSNRIDFKFLTMVSIVMFGVFLLSVFILSLKDGKDMSTMLVLSPSLVLPNLFFSIIQGASGEESGWRGYLLPRMESKYGFVKGNIVLGFVWAFWHLPLWFLSGEYFGIELLIYIIVFVVAVVSVSFFLGVVLKKSNNLFVAFWIHFLFNFSVSFYLGESLVILIAMMFSYLALAIAAYVVYNHSKSKMPIDV